MEVTIATPAVGTEAYFTFKEPYSLYIRNKFNINTLSTKMKVISVISMRDMIRTDLRDPFTEIYEPVGLSEVDYKRDLNDNVYMISYSLRTCDGVERYVRVPLNYLAEQSLPASVEYNNRIIMLDLGSLPSEVDLRPLFSDLIDYIETRVGVTPEVKDVAIGDTLLLDVASHELRETVRTNTISVHKTMAIQLAELRHEHDQMLNRLRHLGISLATTQI